MELPLKGKLLTKSAATCTTHLLHFVKTLYRYVIPPMADNVCNTHKVHKTRYTVSRPGA